MSEREELLKYFASKVEEGRLETIQDTQTMEQSFQEILSYPKGASIPFSVALQASLTPEDLAEKLTEFHQMGNVLKIEYLEGECHGFLHFASKQAAANFMKMVPKDGYLEVRNVLLKLKLLNDREADYYFCLVEDMLKIVKKKLAGFRRAKRYTRRMANPPSGGSACGSSH